MIRLFLVLFILAILSLISMWFIENNGELVVNWLGYRIQTSIAFATVFLVLVVVTIVTFIQMFLMIKNAPKNLQRTIAYKKKDQGVQALTSGFIAVAAGDTKSAKKNTKRAKSYLGETPLTELLSAQTYLLDGDTQSANKTYKKMLQKEDTEIIALKALLSQSISVHDYDKALFLAEKAKQKVPNADWLIRVLIELYTKQDQWNLAIEQINNAIGHKILTKNEGKRLITLIEFYQLESSIEPIDESIIEKMMNIIPDFPPIVSYFIDILAKKGNIKKAQRVLIKSNKNYAHPVFFEKYIELIKEYPRSKRIAKAEKFLISSEQTPENNIVFARMCLELGEITKARNYLKISLGQKESKSMCHLMAEIEQKDNSPSEVVKKWLQRAEHADEDNNWICSNCGTNSESWKIKCYNCNSFDSFKWQSPKSRLALIYDEENKAA